MGSPGVADAVEVREGLAPLPDDPGDEVVVIDEPEVDDPLVAFDYSAVSFSMPDPERDALLLASVMNGSQQVQVIGTAGDDSFFDEPEIHPGPVAPSTDREWT